MSVFSRAPASPARPFRPLNRRAVAWVLLYSTLFTLAMTAMLFGIDYLDQRDNAIAQLRFAAVSHRQGLANSVWELDMPATRLQLEGLAASPMVGQAVLTMSIGQTVRAGRQADARVPEDTLSWTEKLVSPEHPNHVVGHLHLYVDRQAFLQRIENNALRILAAEAVKGISLALLIAWLISKLVTRHLSQMAAQVASLRPAALGQPLALRRRKRNHCDELDQLCDAFNQLHRQLIEYIENRRVLEEELRNHRDHLSDMVSERTRSLEQLRGFHSLIIQVLTRFINLPPGQANEAVDHGLAEFGEYFGAERCLLFTYTPEACGFRIANAWPALQAHGDADEVFLPSDALSRSLLTDRTSRIWLSSSGTNEDGDPLLARLAAKTYTAVGVEIKGDIIGLLCLTGCSVAQGGDNASLLELAARVSANMLDHKAAQTALLDTQQALQKANLELLALSRHDPLTGLANRRHFDELKAIEFRRALRTQLPLSVLMCDVDQFKNYNDTYGHACGDRCLVALAECMKPRFCRAGDLVARLGGEEFAVLLPNIDGGQALMLAERLRQAVWDMNLPHTASSVADRVTISIGVACLKHDRHTDFDALLQDADLALYRAKDGRNRVMLAE